MSAKVISVLAHVDAGKTTLTERVLFTAGKIKIMGEVDDGLSTMDFLALEKEKGITIEAGVSSFQWKGDSIYIIDTPGHIDFGFEVDNALDVVDVVILVICGSSGIESQTLNAWRKLKEKNIPAIIFVNKLDLERANFDEILFEVEEEFEVKPLLFNLPHYEDGELKGSIDVLNEKYVCQKDSKDIEVLDMNEGQTQDSLQFKKELIEAISETSDFLMDKYLAEEEFTLKEKFGALTPLFEAGDTLPVVLGSAKKNIGVRQILNLIKYMPSRIRETKSALRIVYVRGHGEKKYYIVQLLSEEINDPRLKLLGLHADDLDEIQKPSLNGIYAWKTDLSFNVGDVLNHSLSVLESKSYESESLVQISIVPDNTDEYEKISYALKEIMRNDPTVQMETNVVDGTIIVFVCGEVHWDNVDERLKNSFGCFYKWSDPEVKYHEVLKAMVSFEMESSHLDYTLYIRGYLKASDMAECSIVLPDEMDDSVKEVVTSTFNEIVHEGFLGKGELFNTEFVIEEIDRPAQVPLGLVKKSIKDAVSLSVKKEDVEVQQPYCEMHVYIDQEMCGMVKKDLESRSGKILRVDYGKYHLSHIIVEIPLKEIFGYGIKLRTLTQGKGFFNLFYKNHQ